MPILRKLQARQARRTLVSIAGYIFGIPLMFLGPLMLGTMFWLSCLLLYRWYPWTWFFWGTCAIVIPVLIYTEIRTSGAFMSEAISEEEATRGQIAHGMAAVGGMINPGMGSTLSMAAMLASPRASMAGFIELFLLGPRMLLSSFQSTRLTMRLRGNDMQRTAQLLHDLRRANIGIAITRLLHKGEEPADLELPLTYLVFYDWAGVAADQSKAWILTEAKTDLGTA
jgi:uncharacterized membrane protein YjfL (UPF0719 family)